MSWSGFGGEPPRIYPLTLGIYKVTIEVFQKLQFKVKNKHWKNAKSSFQCPGFICEQTNPGKQNQNVDNYRFL